MLSLPALYRGVHQVSAAHADLVGDLQKFLLGIGYTIVYDEVFGPQTERVVREYQHSRSLAVDGKVGPQTWGSLLLRGFLPKDFTADRVAFEGDPNYPPRPVGQKAPNGMALFGQGFDYMPHPLPTMPEYIKVDPNWVRYNIGTARVSQLIGVPGARESGTMPFNVKLISQVEALFAYWEQVDLVKLVKSFGGSWVTRFVRGSETKVSNHSFGTAFDINVAWNGYRRLPALVGREGTVRPLVPSAYALGFYWGGWYNDGMHFEGYKQMNAAEIERALQQLKEA